MGSKESEDMMAADIFTAPPPPPHRTPLPTAFSDSCERSEMAKYLLRLDVTSTMLLEQVLSAYLIRMRSHGALSLNRKTRRVLQKCSLTGSGALVPVVFLYASTADGAPNCGTVEYIKEADWSILRDLIAGDDGAMQVVPAIRSRSYLRGAKDARMVNELRFFGNDDSKALGLPVNPIASAWAGQVLCGDVAVALAPTAAYISNLNRTQDELIAEMNRDLHGDDHGDDHR